MVLLVDFRLNIFTSKVSNGLLPFGVEGAGSFKSNLTSEIPNKYIYEAFLMIYLSILLFCFLSLFDTSKELIEGSQRV